MELFRNIADSLLHLAFPLVCEGCGSDLVQPRHHLCVHCLQELPATKFQLFDANPVERIFWGRLPIIHATSQFYYSQESVMQKLMHRFKYKEGKSLGHFLGSVMGEHLLRAPRFEHVDALIPLPLYRSKEAKRGFNQATVICEGMSESFGRPVLHHVVERNKATETQTKKSRIERWQNMEGRFEVTSPELIRNKHVLLVDDVVTTGATLEACGKVLLSYENVSLSIATLCFAAGN